MTKTCKKVFLSVFLAIFFAVCAGLFASCNGTKDDAVTYTVTVRYDETTPAKGVKVTVGKGSAKFDTKETDDNGMVEFSLSPDDYEITVKADGYSVAAGADLSLTKDKRELTVTLTENFAYKVNLVNVDGTPYYAEGVMVGVCTLSGNCLTPVALNENGTARCEAEKGDYHVKITGLPETVSYEHDKDDYYTGKNFSAEETEMTITVYPVTPVLSAAPMTDAEKTAFEAKGFGYTASTVAAYHFTKTLKAGETAYYSITADCDGDYKFYKDNTAYYLQNGKEFKKGNQGQAIFSSLTLKAGTTYYFNVSNLTDAEKEAEFVVEVPVVSKLQITGAGTVNVMIGKEGENAIIELTPAIGASFKLTAQGTQKTSIKSYTSDYYAETAVHEDSDYKVGADCSEKFTEDKIGESVYFSVAVTDVASYPVSFEVKVERISDGALTNTTTVLHTTENLSQYADNTDNTKELTPVSFDGTATLVYNDTDKFYHLGTADGPVVVVMLTQKSDRFALDGGLVYLEEFNMKNSDDLYVLDVTTAADKADLNKGNTYYDYRTLLRGFGSYELKPIEGSQESEYVKPTITEQSYYAKFVNSDGVYPLTKELEGFLKVFAQNNVDNIIGTAAEGKEWLFACYYYGAAIEADVVVGEYESADGYKLTVNKRGTYIVTQFNPRAGGWTEAERGTWEKTGENAYNFTWTDMEVVYTVTRNAQTGALTWVDTVMENAEPYGVFEVPADPVVGNYENEDGYKLTVNADGTYVIMQENPRTGELMEYESGTWVKNNDGTYTFTAVFDFGNGPEYATNSVTRAANGNLTYVDQNEYSMEFTPVAN